MNGGCARLPVNGDVNLAASADMHDMRLNRESVLGDTDIAHQYRSDVLDLDGKIVYLANLRHHRVGRNLIIETTDLRVSDGDDQVVIAQRLHNIHGRKIACLELVRVEIN